MNRLEMMNIKNKSVIVRCDFNVPIKNGVITDNSRIEKSLKTIKYLIENNCKIILLSHLGRVKTIDDKNNNTLKIVAFELNKLLNKKVIFLSECYGAEVKNIVSKMNLGDIILLENTRIMDLNNKLESSNDLRLAKFWAGLADVFVMDAFGSSHRAHASTAGIAEYLPSCIGYLVEEELDKLNDLIDIKNRPFTIFMGGAKVEDKLPIIKKLLPKCDYLLLGGGIANSFLKACGFDVRTSLATSDENVLKELALLMTNYPQKIILPLDFVYDDKSIMDLGVETMKKYAKYIFGSQLVFVNGTPGKFEDENFANGTRILFDCLDKSGKKIILGGGDTVSAAKKFGYENKFYFQSSGGGATLEYIADGKLEALEWQK